MPNLTDVILTDSVAASKTFAARGNTGGVALLITTGAAKPALESTMTLSSRKQSNDANRVNLKFTMPVIELDSNAQPQVVDNNIVDVSMRFSPSSTLLSRQDARAYVKSVMDNALFTALTDDGSGIF